MSKFIILGDIHIGKGIGIGKPGSLAGLNSRIQDQLDILEWVLNQADERGVKNIFVTGDVYEDPRPHPSLISFFLKWVKKCGEYGITVHIIAGNHDILRTGSYTISALDIITDIELNGGVVYKEFENVNIPGATVSLVPYRDRRMYEVDTSEEALNILQKDVQKLAENRVSGNANVLIGHLAIEGSIFIGDEIDDELNEIFCPTSMFKDWDFTWMGHVHNPQVRHDKDGYYVAHIGSMERSDFSKTEMTGKKIIVVFDSNTRKFEEVTIPNRNIFKIDISVPNTELNPTEFVKNFLKNFKGIQNSIIKLDVKLSSNCEPLNRSEVSDYFYKELSGHYISYFTESRAIELVSSRDDFIIDNSMSPEKAIATYWDSQEDLSDEDRARCKALAAEINDAFEESLKK